jgi:hypothetical protein
MFTSRNARAVRKHGKMEVAMPEHQGSGARRSLREELARFLEDPSRTEFRELLRGHTGESASLDFKREWPPEPALVKHVLAFANSGGGCIVVGVSEGEEKALEPTGLSSLRDKAVIGKALHGHIPSRVDFDVLDFSYSESEYAKLTGKKFQVMVISDRPEYIPFLSARDGDGISRTTIYVRRGTESVPASYEELQGVLNRRLATGYDSRKEFSLEQELRELKVLYDAIPRTIPTLPLLKLGVLLDIPNPAYPRENIEEFVTGLIEAKKKRIATLTTGNLQ